MLILNMIFLNNKFVEAKIFDFLFPENQYLLYLHNRLQISAYLMQYFFYHLVVDTAFKLGHPDYF